MKENGTGGTLTKPVTLQHRKQRTVILGNGELATRTSRPRNVQILLHFH